ncbi:MAG: glycosyltransferase family 4 protein [Sediminibacterium sp.]|nr:glycosyltransferase family 4 protein [Sediminibacterium sp.]
MQQLGTVDILGPYQPVWRLQLARLFNQLCLRLLGKRYAFRHSHFISKGYAAYFNKQLKNKQYDCIVAPAASCEIAHLKTSVPVVYITDGTFGGCLNYHKALTNLLAFSEKEGHEIEQRAVNASRFVLASSDWCGESVQRQYHQKHVEILPYGANFDALPERVELSGEPPRVWRLLFVGVYWDNKGGDIAYNCFKRLKEQKYPVALTVVGCEPPAYVDRNEVNVIPFLDKNDAAGQDALKALYATHHFLVLPTRFDCTPIVINEASAFAIPSLVANSGGVAGHLKEGVNGFLLNYEDTGAGYADKIAFYIQHPELYVELRKETRLLYEQSLNWDKWTEAFAKLLEQYLPEIGQ